MRTREGRRDVRHPRHISSQTSIMIKSHLNLHLCHRYLDFFFLRNEAGQWSYYLHESKHGTTSSWLASNFRNFHNFPQVPSWNCSNNDYFCVVSSRSITALLVILFGTRYKPLSSKERERERIWVQKLLITRKAAKKKSNKFLRID